MHCFLGVGTNVGPIATTLRRSWGWLTRLFASSDSSPPLPNIERMEASLISFQSDVSASLTGLAARIASMETGLEAKIASVETGLAARIASMETGLEAKIASMENELAVFHPSLNPWLQTDAASVETTPSEREMFKQELRANYQPDEEPGMLTCMAFGARLPSAKVRAAHIWPARARSVLVNSWFGLSQGDLETCRNGLLLAESIEKNFDDLRIAFSYHVDEDSFRVRILDHRLRGPAQFIGELGPGTTYSSIDGRPLLLSSSCKKPFRRLLYYHYANALEQARVRRWTITPETPQVPADQKVLDWLQGCSPAALWPGVLRYPLKHQASSKGSRGRATGSSSSSSVVQE